MSELSLAFGGLTTCEEGGGGLACTPEANKIYYTNLKMLRNSKCVKLDKD